MATTGIIDVTVFNAARELWGGPEVRLVLADPFHISGFRKLADPKLKKGTNNIRLKDVPADAGQKYILMVDADKHRSHSVFPVKPRANGVTPVNVMLVPDNPVPNFAGFTYNELQLKSPQFHEALRQGVAEGDLLGLPKSDPASGTARLAALLNIEAKLRATALKEGSAVDYVRKIKNLDCCEPDRIKAEVAPEMPANVKGLKGFNKLNEDINEVNHKGFPVSFKQTVTFASLQLSFAKKPVDGLLPADIDIDLLTDIGHFGEVIKNDLLNIKTDPFTVYALLFDQGIRPLYTLKV